MANRPRAKGSTGKRPRANAKKVVVLFDENGVKGVNAPDEDMDSMDFESIEQRIEMMCEESGTVTPIVFLKTVMDGKDPRKNSNIYKHLLHIENLYGVDTPPPAGSYEWAEMVDMIKMEYQGAPVTLQESSAAVKQLAEYMHSKKRNIQIKSDVNITNEVTTLTKAEVILFDKKFNSKY